MTAGRPPIFNSCEEMDAAICAYFDKCNHACDEECAKDCDIREPVTISGLAEALCMTTETLRCYGEKEEFSATIKKAKLKVEKAVEQMLLYGNNGATGSIFWLKNNAGWKDKTEREHSGPNGGPIPVAAVELSDDQLAAYLKDDK